MMLMIVETLVRWSSCRDTQAHDGLRSRRLDQPRRMRGQSKGRRVEPLVLVFVVARGHPGCITGVSII